MTGWSVIFTLPSTHLLLFSASVGQFCIKLVSKNMFELHISIIPEKVFEEYSNKWNAK